MRMAGFELKSYNSFINENKENIDNNDVSRLRVTHEEVTVTNEAQNKVFDENEIVEYDQYNDNIGCSLPLLSRQHLQQNNGEELAEEEINYSTNLCSTSLSDNELIVTEHFY
ncbi:unnamed protein product [Parnassius apollo]|uniref:(apollo) hypothetical protein n=1 Tax=Parnassius apollo TaxID=110799 RepID=A0A8S3WNE7_PARAO|nr:unnamed protein product [Parnassius apollo]